MMGEDDQITHAEITTFSEDGREQGADSRNVVPVDILITGAGRFPELIYVPGKNDDDQTKGWETLFPYPSPNAEQDIGMFRPGEATTDYKAVVEAIGAGRRAARSIHMYLTGEKITPPTKTLFEDNIPGTIFESVDGLAKSERTKMPELPVDDRIKTFEEADLVISEEEAKYESNRCLQCCLTCYNKDIV